VSLCRRERIISDLILSSVVLVTYMDVGNADLVWNTDRPYFPRVFRSFRGTHPAANLISAAVPAPMTTTPKKDTRNHNAMPAATRAPMRASMTKDDPALKVFTAVSEASNPIVSVPAMRVM
jgi:hypothetical protein